MKKIILLLSVTALTACQTVPNYQPIIDDKNVDLNTYSSDLTECKTFAEKSQSDAVAGALLLALIGGAAGAGLGAAYGDDYIGRGAAIGAAGFGVAGGSALAADNIMTYQTIVNNCLEGRGYKVLMK